MAAGDFNYSPEQVSLNEVELGDMARRDKLRLLGCLTELLDTERLLRESKDQLELYQLRFKKVSAQMENLYAEHEQSRRTWAEEKVTLQEVRYCFSVSHSSVFTGLAMVVFVHPYCA